MCNFISGKATCAASTPVEELSSTPPSGSSWLVKSWSGPSLTGRENEAASHLLGPFGWLGAGLVTPLQVERGRSMDLLGSLGWSRAGLVLFSQVERVRSMDLLGPPGWPRAGLVIPSEVDRVEQHPNFWILLGGSELVWSHPHR